MELILFKKVLILMAALLALITTNSTKLGSGEDTIIERIGTKDNIVEKQIPGTNFTEITYTEIMPDFTNSTKKQKIWVAEININRGKWSEIQSLFATTSDMLEAKMKILRDIYEK